MSSGLQNNIEKVDGAFLRGSYEPVEWQDIIGPEMSTDSPRKG